MEWYLTHANHDAFVLNTNYHTPRLKSSYTYMCDILLFNYNTLLDVFNYYIFSIYLK